MAPDYSMLRMAAAYRTPTGESAVNELGTSFGEARQLLIEARAELYRLRADNERLTGIIANVCLALGYEESAWPCHWRTTKEEK